VFFSLGLICDVYSIDKENARKQAATESLRMGTRGNTKKGKT
jgi:hypothetical protein